MKEQSIEMKRLVRALKKVAEAGELMETPAWLLGSKKDPSYTYGVIIASRELAVSLLGVDDDLEITGMLRPSNRVQDGEELH